MPTDRNQPHTTRLGVEYIKGHAYTGTEKGEHDMTDGDCLALYTAPEVLARFKRDGWPEWVELDGFHQRLMWSVCEWWVQRVSEDRVCWLDYRPDAHTALCILRDHAIHCLRGRWDGVEIHWREDVTTIALFGPGDTGGEYIVEPTYDAALQAALAAAEGERP